MNVKARNLIDQYERLHSSGAPPCFKIESHANSIIDVEDDVLTRLIKHKIDVDWHPDCSFVSVSYELGIESLKDLLKNGLIFEFGPLHELTDIEFQNFIDDLLNFIRDCHFMISKNAVFKNNQDSVQEKSIVLLSASWIICIAHWGYD